jgi:DNA primase
MNPFAASPSPYKDIDELIQNEPSKISEVINNKVEAFSFILADTIKDRDLNKLEDIDKIKKIILPVLNSVKDINTKSLYIKKLEEITGIIYGNTQEKRNITLSSSAKNQTKPLMESTETRYLQLLLFAENRKEEYFLDEKYISDKVQQEIFSFITLNRTLTKSELFEKINSNTEAQKVLEDMIFNANKLPKESELENELLYLQRGLKVKYYKQIQKNLVSKIAISDEIEDEEEKSKALKKLQKVAKILQKLKNE